MSKKEIFPMLDRETEERVLEFCAAQKVAFTQEHWLNPSTLGLPPSSLAVIALYLAGSAEYGHSSELEQIAEQLQPECLGHFEVMVKETHFNCSRFRNMLEHYCCPESGIRRKRKSAGSPNKR